MDKKKYIYESPDGGKTLYRREFNNYNGQKELIKPKGEIKRSSYYYDFDRNRPFNDGQAKQPNEGESNRDSEFKAIADIIARACLFGIDIEVIWSSIKAMKESDGKISILTALQRGADEWDI